MLQAASYRYEQGLFDRNCHWYLYGKSGEQLKQVENEDTAKTEVERTDKLTRRQALIKEQRELEARIRAIQNEVAALDDIPF